MYRNQILLAALLSFTLPGFGQMATRRASMTGSRGDGGKCTIEVRVDQAAEVEVSGDMGRIRTLSGQPASWTRFECSSPLPRNPVDFRFKGIDGRGRVELIRDPQSSRGAAVVRIEDSQGGSEGYTFDLEWSGGYNSGSGGYGGGRRDDRDDRYDRDRNSDGFNRGGRNSLITCSSDGNRRTYCDADTTNGVRLVREHGNSACRLGSTWGFDRRGIWVDRGCRGDFQTGR